MHPVETSQSKCPGNDDDSAPPPNRCFWIEVAEHEFVVGIEVWIGFLSCQSLFGRLVVLPESVRLGRKELLQVAWFGPSPSGLDVVEVPQQHVDKSGSKSHVDSDQIANICRSEIWRALSRQLRRVDFHLLVENESLVVFCIERAVALSGKQDLRQEWEAMYGSVLESFE